MIKTNKQYIPSFVLASLSALVFISALIYLFTSPQSMGFNILDNWSSLLSILSITALSILFILKKERPLFIFIISFSIPILISIFTDIIGFAHNLNSSFITDMLPSIFINILTLVFLFIYAFSGKQRISAIVILSILLGFSFYSQVTGFSTIFFNMNFPLFYVITILNILSDIFLYSAMILFVVLSKKNSFSG